MQISPPPRSYWVRLLTVALLIRVVAVFVSLPSMPFTSDAGSYTEVATEFLQRFPPSEAFYWPPGEPMFLAGLYSVFGTSAAVPRIATIVVNVLCVVVVVLLANRILNEPRSVRFAGWIAALYPPSILMSGQPYSQPLASLALLLMAYWLWRGWQEDRIAFFGLSGLALGIGILTRSSMLSLAPLLLVFWIIALRQRAGKAKPGMKSLIAGPLLGGSIVTAIILPIFLFNYNSGAGFNISTNNESNFFVGNCQYTHFYKTTHLAVQDLDLLDSTTRAYIIHYRDLPNARQEMMKAAVEYIVSHPVPTLNRTLSRIRSFWGFDYVMSREIQTYYGFSNRWLVLLIAFEGGGYFLTAALAIVGLFLARSMVVPSATRFLLWLIVAYQMPYMLTYAAGYYHFPVVWLLTPFAGAALAHLLPLRRERWQEIRRRPWLVAALLLLALVQIEYGVWAIIMQ